MNSRSFFVLALVAVIYLSGSAYCQAPGGAPVVYNHVTKPGLPLDSQVKAAFTNKYKFVDIVDNSSFEVAKSIKGDAQLNLGANAKIVSGNVLLAYIISVDGLATDPTIISSTDPILSRAAIEKTKTWRFEPAKLNGLPVSTLIGQQFNYHK